MSRSYWQYDLMTVFWLQKQQYLDTPLHPRGLNESATSTPIKSSWINETEEERNMQKYTIGRYYSIKEIQEAPIDQVEHAILVSSDKTCVFCVARGENKPVLITLKGTAKQPDHLRLRLDHYENAYLDKMLVGLMQDRFKALETGALSPQLAKTGFYVHGCGNVSFEAASVAWSRELKRRLEKKESTIFGPIDDPDFA